MRKQIMKDGNSFKIRITKKEVELYELCNGTIVEIRINKLKKEAKK